jgi:hypothetical protein
LRRGGIGAIWILKASDFILSVSFDDSTVEEGSVPVPLDSPRFFYTLDMEGFFFDQKGLVLVVEVLLEGVVLAGRMKVLLFQDLVLNLDKKDIVLWFLTSPFFKICSKKLSFIREITSGRTLPTLLSNVLKVLFH